MRITKAAAIAASTVALAMGAVACNDDGSSSAAKPPGSAAPTATPTAAHSDAPSTSGGTGGSASTGGGTGSGGGTGGSGSGGGSSTGGSSSGGNGSSAKPVPAASRCRTDELKAYIQLEPPIGKLSSGLLKLSNVGKRSCEVTGYAGLGGLLADNSQLSLNTTRVPLPFPPTADNSTIIKPGDNAFAGLKWSPCDKADTTCHVLAGLVVTPPDQTTQLTADVTGLDNKPVEQLTVSATGITVGTLQPTVGVLFQN
ncbi:DUF4232 domain-containing protein [Kitasatospora acidiphila]|uniref:DUF4232 domain-containing protein n=1 Tax=Kitasatospora acidiphila TaxID=2567942 RepID=UPI003C73B5F4